MYLNPEKYPFFEYEYGARFFWQYREIINKFFLIILGFLAFFNMLTIEALYLRPVNTLSFQILYDCIVYNTDQYFKSLDTIENVVIKKSKRFHQYQQNFANNYPILLKIFPNFILETLFSIRVWLDSWLQLDHVDRKLFEQQNRMRLFPHASFKCRYSFEMMKNSLLLNICLTIEAILFVNCAFFMVKLTIRSLFNMALISIPMNATVLSEFIIEKMPMQAQFIFIFVACIQGCFCLSPFLVIAIICKDFHHIEQWITIIQLRLKSKKHSIQIKMKFDDLYGRLMFGRKIAFTCGYLGDITFHRLFEGFLIYVMIFFLILGFYVESH
ncbi:hypothetical protein DERP_013152 [Dermatophagoides pteronyssinus]|uniref:Gustatory receptor n=1 Tax=Dermatophagoides pteronyssinus TaxID=6956 RepID=A0ABQ8J3A3_DERPT|nr:hypothetical protein DERP_013152 [Dermatophagoides pteronyssinus]